jgi:hypothetical protein
MAIPIHENRTILKDAEGKQLIVPEQSSGPVMTMTLRDELGAAVPLAAIGTATLTIYARDEATQPIINGVDHVNIKNVGRATIHATSGLLTLTPESLDHSIQNVASDLEWHRFLIEIGYNSTKSLKYEIDVPVRNLYKVT